MINGRDFFCMQYVAMHKETERRGNRNQNALHEKCESFIAEINCGFSLISVAVVFWAAFPFNMQVASQI